MKVAIFGDIASWNLNGFTLKRLNKCIVKDIQEADVVIFNLEGLISLSQQLPQPVMRRNPMTNGLLKQFLKATNNLQPQVYSDQSILDLLKLNPKTVVTLANNHVKDIGERGFYDTLRILQDSSLMCVGQGRDGKHLEPVITIAPKLSVVNANWIGALAKGYPIKLFNSFGKEFGGVFMDEGRLMKLITALKEKKHTVILIVHGGSMKNRARTMSDLKKLDALPADVKILHHPHVYIKSQFESTNCFVLGDLVFSSPGALQPFRESAYLKIEVKLGKLSTQLVKMPANKMYKY